MRTILCLINCEGQGHRSVSTKQNPFKENGEPKRYRTKVLLLTNLPLKHPGAKPALLTPADTDYTVRAAYLTPRVTCVHSAGLSQLVRFQPITEPLLGQTDAALAIFIIMTSYGRISEQHSKQVGLH